MRQSIFIFLALVLVGAAVFIFWFSGENSNHAVSSTSTGIPVSNNSPGHNVENNFSNTPSGSKFSIPLCPRSIWGYAYVYPNETLTILLYPSIDYLKNTTFVDLYLGNISISYSTSDVLSLTNSSGIAGRVPLPLYLKFSSPGRGISITGNALLLQLWKGRAIVNESSMPVWLYFQVASVKPEDIHLKFGRYSSLYTSFKKGVDTFEYTATITNLYSKPITIQNVSFPLASLQVYPKPPDIKVVNFNLINTTPDETLNQLPPNSTALLKVVVSVPSNVEGIYFKPKLVIAAGGESIAIPAPPMEYIRVVNCG